jgi:TfoX/Sxy family transcriptional regulator of competence genes
MPYDEFLADRIRNTLKEFSTGFEEKKMFGGICFMVDEKMCVGAFKKELMARVDPEIHFKAMREEGCRAMEETNQSMLGFIMISPEAIDTDRALERWIKLALDYNPKAKNYKKR